MFNNTQVQLPTEDTAGFAIDDMNLTQTAGAILGVTTVAGAAAVGTIVIPGQVGVGLVTAGILVGAGTVKQETGSYFPFLRDVDPTVDDAMAKKETKTKPAPKKAKKSKTKAEPPAVTKFDGTEEEIENL